MTQCLPTIVFFNDTATTEISTLSLHDALPIYDDAVTSRAAPLRRREDALDLHASALGGRREAARGANHVRQRLARLELRSEEHTSELQSRQYLVCRLLLEQKKTPQRRCRIHAS